MKALAQSGLQPTVEPTGFQPVGGSVVNRQHLG